MILASSSLGGSSSGGSTAGTAFQWFRPTLGLVAAVQPIATRATTEIAPSPPAAGNFIPGVANPLTPSPLPLAAVAASKPPGDPVVEATAAASTVVANLGELMASSSSELGAVASEKVAQAQATPGGFPWWLLLAGYVLGKAL